MSADTWKSYIYKYWTKAVLKDYYSKKLLNYLLVGLQNFLIEFCQVYQKVISPTRKSIFYLLEKTRYFCVYNLSIEEFWHKFERLLSGLSASLDLNIPPNLELILGNWHLVNYKRMKHLESNYIWNFLSHMKFLKRVR